MALRFWTAEQIERAKKRGAEMAEALKAGQSPHLSGCLCADCRAKATSPTPKGQDTQKEPT